METSIILHCKSVDWFLYDHNIGLTLFIDLNSGEADLSRLTNFYSPWNCQKIPRFSDGLRGK